jgi:muramoyltetrapeptide carboxypeptidase
VKKGKSLYRRQGYLAGSDKLRGEDLNMMIRDPDVEAIFFARGGYGSARILPYLDLNTLEQNPKILMGFSDLTILLLHVLQSGQLVTFHGPMVSKFGVDCPPETVDCMLRVLAGEFPLDLLTLLPEHAHVKIFRHGQSSGPLVGGCLSLLQTMTGTGLEMDMSGKILFWEEVGEKLYRIDRMLNHLSRTGCFNNLNGMIIGKLAQCVSNRKGEKKRYQDLLAHYFADYSYPILYDVPIGHTKYQLTLPQGGYCHIDTFGKRIIIDRYPAIHTGETA